MSSPRRSRLHDVANLLVRTGRGTSGAITEGTISAATTPLPPPAIAHLSCSGDRGSVVATAAATTAPGAPPRLRRPTRHPHVRSAAARVPSLCGWGWRCDQVPGPGPGWGRGQSSGVGAGWAHGRAQAWMLRWAGAEMWAEARAHLQR
eukprot:scaffold88044_cov75-Phaeocystis_antarctica.AAC.6